MEFDELKKVWDSQNKEPMYVIDEQALHQRIRTKRNHTRLASNLNEFGLMAIALATGVFLIIKNWNDDNLYDYPPIVILLLTGVYVFIKRFERKKGEKKFDESILGDLDQAIWNMDFEIKRARTFLLWYLIPLIIPTTLNMYMNNASAFKWILVLFMFVLSYVVVRLGLKMAQIPKRSQLEKLRNKILSGPASNG